MPGWSNPPAVQPEKEIVPSLNNKGYSSVAVQNIHAVSRIPHGFDGAIESTQRRMRQLAFANGSPSRSLPVVHRVTSNGEAWLGPFRRDLYLPTAHKNQVTHTEDLPSGFH